MTSPLTLILAQELAALAPVRPLIPPVLYSELVQRSESLVRTARPAAVRRVTPSALQAPLVSRPTLPPRPLDPFFFEVKKSRSTH